MRAIYTGVLVVAFCLSSVAEGRAQQATSGWRVEAAGGVVVGLSGHDLSEAGDPGWLLGATVERRVAEEVWLGMGWTGAWLRGAPGGDSRQSMSLTGTVRPGRSISLRAGAGVAVSTVVDVEGPPPGPLAGDVLVTIGSTMGGALSAGGGLDLPLGSRLSLGPSLDVHLHRVAGHTLSHIALAVRARFGG